MIVFVEMEKNVELSVLVFISTHYIVIYVTIQTYAEVCRCCSILTINLHDLSVII